MVLSPDIFSLTYIRIQGPEAYTIFGALCTEKNAKLWTQNWVWNLIFIYNEKKNNKLQIYESWQIPETLQNLKKVTQSSYELTAWHASINTSLLVCNISYFCKFYKNIWPCEHIARAPPRDLEGECATGPEAYWVLSFTVNPTLLECVWVHRHMSKSQTLLQIMHHWKQFIQKCCVKEEYKE